MDPSIEPIPLTRLILMFIPVLVVFLIAGISQVIYFQKLMVFRLVLLEQQQKID